MAKVSLHIYDITNSPNPKTNATIQQLNRYTRDTFGVGGVFHGAVEVFGEEWSFGFCERGSGVFSCPPKSNPMYTYRETIEMGVTAMDRSRVGQLMAEMSAEWPGRKYDLLARNCNHFCNELAERLGVGPIPIWVNRFANLGDAALEIYDSTTEQLQAWREYMYESSQSIYSYFAGTPQTYISAGRGDSIPREEVLDSSYAVPVTSNKLEVTSGSFRGSTQTNGHDADNRRASLPVYSTIPSNN